MINQLYQLFKKMLNKYFFSDWVDSSGIVLHVTGQKRKFDAAIMELGLEYTDKMAIPGRQEAFPLTAYCIPQCTGVVIIHLS